jgi:hypothetical protein
VGAQARDQPKRKQIFQALDPSRKTPSVEEVPPIEPLDKSRPSPSRNDVRAATVDCQFKPVFLRDVTAIQKRRNRTRQS